MNGDIILISNVGSAPADITIFIGDINNDVIPIYFDAAHNNAIAAGGHVEYQLPSSLWVVTDGPVRVVSNNGQPLIVTQRVIYKNSLNELLAVDELDLATEYLFPWFDNNGVSDSVMISNVGTTTANVRVYFGFHSAAEYDMNNIPPNGKWIWQPPMTTTSGPLTVECTNGQPLVVSQRVTYADSFNEVTGLTPSQLSSEVFFNWYDNNPSWGMNGDWIMVANYGLQSTNAEIYINGTLATTLSSIPAGGYGYWCSPIPRTSGPVKIRSTNGQPLVASQRVIYKNSFNETMAVSNSTLGNLCSFTWYDNNPVWGMNSDIIMISNNGSQSTTAQIYIGGSIVGTTGSIAPGNVTYWSSPIVRTGGPVKIQSTNGQPILVSQRVIYYNSFNEFVGKYNGLT